jgi:YD repeat-containing protein
MNGLRAGIGTIALALMTGIGAANACQGQNVLFEDNFDKLDPTWGEATSEIGVENHQLVLKPEANFSLWVPSNAGVYDDIDFCADFTTVEAVNADSSYAGLIFWYTDDDNFYAFEYDANGKASVWRRQRGRWLKQVFWQPADGLKPNDGATNQLRVVTVGNQASFYVNGNQFSALKGTPPDNGQQIGMIASSPESAVATYAIGNVKVTEPSKEQQPATKGQTPNDEQSPTIKP